MPCRQREESAARCGPKGTLLIERLASHPTAKKKFVYDKNQPLLSPLLEGFRWILPPRRSAREWPMSPFRGRRALVETSQCFQHGERSLVPTLVLTMWFLCFESLSYPWKTEGRKRLKVCIPSDHSTPPFHPPWLPVLPSHNVTQINAP